MSNFYKIISTIFLAMFIFLFFAPAAIFAAEANFTPQVSIGEFKAGIPMPVAKDARTIWNYIMAIYKYAIGVVGIVAAVVLMVGGIMWLTAGGNQTRIGEAKAYITASLTGLLLALTSFLILATVNPKLTQFNPLQMITVTEIGCCENTIANTCSSIQQSSCSGSDKKWYKGTDYACGAGGKCSDTTIVCCLEYIPNSSDAMWCEIKKIKDCKKETASYKGATVNKVDPIPNKTCNKFTKGILNIPYYDCK